jgi:phenylpropionate dioxygenase-like ring-hydroxylating dioxygenase large terminal subunit
MIADPIVSREWHPVANSAELADGDVKAVRLLGEDLVLWKTGGQVMVWQDLCVHRGSKFSLGRIVEGGCLQCPYHGWIYDPTGRCVKIPAHPGQTPPPRAQARTFLVREDYGWVWVCLAANPAALPVFPEWDGAGFRVFTRGPIPVGAAGPRIIENFLDLAHLPILHAGILGDAGRPEIKRYNVVRSPAGIEADEIEIFQPDPDGSGQDGIAYYTYRVLRPLTAYLHKRAGASRFTMMLTAAPVTETQTHAWILFSLFNAVSSDADALDWMDRIFAQDVPVVESQRPELLPLDLQAELHLNSDRTSIAYRQWLSELGMTFGTA